MKGKKQKLLVKPMFLSLFYLEINLQRFFYKYYRKVKKKSLEFRAAKQTTSSVNMKTAKIFTDKLFIIFNATNVVTILRVVLLPSPVLSPLILHLPNILPQTTLLPAPDFYLRMNKKN